MRRKIKVGFVEDHEMVRQGIVSLLKDEPTINVLFDVANGAEVLEVLKSKKPDILLLDIEMPVVDGKTALRTITERYKGVQVIMISAHHEKIEIIESIALGAKGFLPKHCDFDKLIDAIYSVYETGYYFDENVTKAMVSEIVSSRSTLNNPVPFALTAQEIIIIKYVCEGLKNREIAERLYLSKRTIDGYRNRIALKTETSNAVDLVHYAIKHGIHKV